MNAPINTAGKSALHPVVIAAAVAVILFCLAGTAAFMGWLPSSMGRSASTTDMSPSDSAALAAPLNDIDAAPGAKLAPEAPPAARPAPVQLAAAEPAHPSNWCGNCGNVESVHEIKTKAKGSGVGAVGGALLGGLLGHQVGGGNGKKVATVAGVVGGAVAGNAIESNMKATISYDVKVRLDDGSHRTFHLQAQNGFSTGDRIKVVNGALQHHAG